MLHFPGEAYRVTTEGTQHRFAGRQQLGRDDGKQEDSDDDGESQPHPARHASGSRCGNVVEDPLERANLKERQKDTYRRLTREWYDWNATMLPEIRESNTHSFTGQELADHFGAKSADPAPDNPASPDD